jgi:hypothetical protein
MTNALNLLLHVRPALLPSGEGAVFVEPPEETGLVFMLSPTEARELAEGLRLAADCVEKAIAGRKS